MSVSGAVPTSAPQIPPTSDPGWFDARLAPIAAELVGTLRDYSPADVHRVLDRLGIDPATRPLVLTLAAMVDPDRSPAELLAWTRTGPVPSRREPPKRHPCPDCGQPVHTKHAGRHRDRCTVRAERLRLEEAGVSPETAHVLAAQRAA